MDELVTRLVNTAGLDPSIAQAAVKTILTFLAQHAPADAMQTLIDATPGADKAIEEGKAEQDEGGYAGFGAMAAYHALTGVGLSGGEVQVVAKETLAYCREKVGEETTGQIVGSVPGLEAFI